ELYDLQADADEKEDLSAREPKRLAAMREALAALRTRLAGPAAGATPRPVDPETEERLAALGYVGGVSAASLREDRPRRDPKDTSGLYNALKHAAQASIEGRFDEARDRVRQALAADPDITEAYTLLGNVEMKAKRYEPAVAAYRQALARDPEHRGAT